MPPDPVGRLERSRARPPPAVGAGVLARAPSSARRFAGCALRDAPRPRRPARRFSAPAPSPTPAAPPRARPARELGLGFPGPILGSACLIPDTRLSAQLAALLLVVAAVEDVPFAAAGDHALRHAGTRELIEAAVEGETLGEPALRLGEEEPLVADVPELLTRDGLQEGVGQEREARLGERHSGNPRCCAMRCFTR